MELVVQKATELGAIRIIPVMMERSIPKFDKDKEQAKVNRWQKIAKEAAEQSGRLIIPFVDPVKPFKDLFLLKKDSDLCVLLWEMEKENMIKKVLQEHRGIKNLLVEIGPEGGFSHEEVESAKAAGFITASLGSRIVRTETASIAVLSILEYEFRCEKYRFTLLAADRTNTKPISSPRGQDQRLQNRPPYPQTADISDQYLRCHISCRKKIQEYRPTCQAYQPECESHFCRL